jgi:hypothetical protein
MCFGHVWVFNSCLYVCVYRQQAAFGELARWLVTLLTTEIVLGWVGWHDGISLCHGSSLLVYIRILGNCCLGRGKKEFRSSRGSLALSRCLHMTSSCCFVLTNSAFGASVICTVMLCSSFDAEVETWNSQKKFKRPFGWWGWVRGGQVESRWRKYCLSGGMIRCHCNRRGTRFCWSQQSI